MWIVLPAVSLALVHIAGDNIAVVPDLAAVLGKDIYITTLIAYLVFGSLITALSAWIGVRTGQELIVVVKKLFGCEGKRILALAILAICLPASALTGGYFAGWVFHTLTGIPHSAAIPICIIIFSLLATGHGEEFLKISNYLALLIVPITFALVGMHGVSISWPEIANGNINWTLVLALIGYNSGGMRPVLIVEAASYLTKKGHKAVYLAILAKMVEGLFTLVMAHMVLMAGAHGPLALSEVAGQTFNSAGLMAFHIVLFCTFTNTMAPAMMVNARQVKIATGLPLWPSLSLAAAIVCIGSYASFSTMLTVMSITGLMMAAVICYTAYFLHKHGKKQL